MPELSPVRLGFVPENDCIDPEKGCDDSQSCQRRDTCRKGEEWPLSMPDENRLLVPGYFAVLLEVEPDETMLDVSSRS